MSRTFSTNSGSVAGTRYYRGQNLFGLSLGGFFDRIVLHQVLQWHHMVTSAGYPPDSVEHLKVNTFWDGLIHASTYIFGD